MYITFTPRRQQTQIDKNQSQWLSRYLKGIFCLFRCAVSVGETPFILNQHFNLLWIYADGKNTGTTKWFIDKLFIECFYLPIKNSKITRDENNEIQNERLTKKTSMPWLLGVRSVKWMTKMIQLILLKCSDQPPVQKTYTD